MGSRSHPHRVLSVCVCVCVSRCLWVCVIEANSLQLRVITIGLYQFLSRSPSCQILAVCGRRLRGVSGSWFPRFLSPAAFLDSDRRRLVCPLLPCATRLSPYGKLRFCLRKAPPLPYGSSASALRKAPFSFSLCITSCNKLSFSATESSRLHCDKSHEKTGGKFRSTPGRMTPIPSHSRVVVFLFFLPITVNYSKNIVQITACPPY